MHATTVTARDIAVASEAFNRLAGLTPSARRLGFELLAYIDRATGIAWPSEGRLAEALGLHKSTINRAKRELADLGLLQWRQRGRHRDRTPAYWFNWSALRGIAAEQRRRVKDAAGRFAKRYRRTPFTERAASLRHVARVQRAFRPRVATAANLSFPENIQSWTNVATTTTTNPAGEAERRLWADIYRQPEHIQAGIYAAGDESLITDGTAAELENAGDGLAYILERLASGTVAGQARGVAAHV